jgi:hypothetical protein
MEGQPNTNITSLELRSEITSTGQLRLSLEEQDVAPPGPEEVVVRVEAAPISPADLAELLGPADVATLTERAHRHTLGPCATRTRSRPTSALGASELPHSAT